MRSLLVALVFSVACGRGPRPLHAQDPPSTEVDQNGDCCCAVGDGSELADAKACAYCISMSICEPGEPPIE